MSKWNYERPEQAILEVGREGINVYKEDDGTWCVSILSAFNIKELAAKNKKDAKKEGLKATQQFLYEALDVVEKELGELFKD